MNDVLIIILVLYLMFIGIGGGIALYLSNPNNNGAYKWFWKYLREDLNIIGTIIIYIILFPAILITIMTDILWRIFETIIIIFWLIFRNR